MTAAGKHEPLPHWHPAKAGYEHDGEIFPFNTGDDGLSLPDLIDRCRLRCEHLNRWMGDAGCAGDRELSEMLALRYGTAHRALRALQDAYELVRFGTADPSVVRLPGGRVEHRQPPTDAERAADAETVWQEWTEPYRPG